MIKQNYQIIMNSELNALAKLPNIVKFQLMTILSFMWAIILTLIVGSYLVLGPTVITHILFLLGVYFTNTVFQKNQNKIIL